MNFKTHKKVESLKKVDEEFYISNDSPGEFQPLKENEEVNFNISIRGLRTLPTFTGPVKLEVSFWSKDAGRLLEK